MPLSTPTGTMSDFDGINWIGDAPSKSDFQAQYDAEEQAYNNTQYQRDRASAYPQHRRPVGSALPPRYRGGGRRRFRR